MSKPRKIRWSKRDDEQLTKAVRNFNAKIKRLEKKDPSIKKALPDKINVRQMKELINTRQDFNREINSLKRFTQRKPKSKSKPEDIVKAPGNDNNINITRWQRSEMNRRAGIINRKRRARRKRIEETEVKSRGKPLGYTRGDIGMGRQEEKALSDINAFTPSMGKSDIEAKFKTLMKESQSDYWENRDREHKQNYIDSLKMYYPEEEIRDVIKQIEEMDYNEFRKIFDAEDPHFEYASTPGEDSANTKKFAEALRTIWLPDNRTTDAPLDTSKGE